MTKDKNIQRWAIVIDWSDGTSQQLKVMPNEVAHVVDDWLTKFELEEYRERRIARFKKEVLNA